MRRLALAASLLAALIWVPAADAAFPGANGKIAYANFVSPTNSEIVTANPDGTGATTLTQNNDFDLAPAWSPDGQRIVFLRINGTTFRGEIWVMNADGTGQTKLTDSVMGAARDSDPAFSGDGSKIVFARTDGPTFNQHVWVMSADGTGQTPLTSGTEFATEPTMSADSQRIAFVRNLSINGTGVDVIFGMPASGGTPSALTPTDGSVNAAGPNFSPSGALLTFSRCEKGPTDEACTRPPEIVTMGSTGGPVTEVTSNSGQSGDPRDQTPAFSPDGTRITFSRVSSGGQTDVLTVGSTGGSTQSVTSSGLAGLPDWQPLAIPPPPSAGGAGAESSPPTSVCFGAKVTIFGTNGDDTIVGTPGNDVIHGFRGKDKINGKGGRDILCGGRGSDRIFGKHGDDILIGGKQSDYLNGGPGQNRIFGGTPGAPEQSFNNVCVDGPGNKLTNCQVIR